MTTARYLESIKKMLREDWGLLLVAVVVSTVLWWNITQRTMIYKWFWSAEVNLENNLKPSLKLADTQNRPKVAIRVRGPRAYLDALKDDSFQMNPDMSVIQEATKQIVLLSQNDLGASPHLLRALPMDRIGIVEVEDINPRRIEVETVWNSSERKIVPNIEGRPAQGYIVSSATVTPSTLTVAGSDPELDLHPFLRNANPIALKGETRSFHKNLTLDDLDLGDLEALDWDSSKTIRLFVVIESVFADREFRGVQIHVTNATEETRFYQYQPKEVDVFLQGARSSIEDATRLSFALGVDLSRLPSGAHEIEADRLTLISMPANVFVRQVTPPSILVDITPVGPPYHQKILQPSTEPKEAPPLAAPETNPATAEATPTEPAD